MRCDSAEIGMTERVLRSTNRSKTETEPAPTFDVYPSFPITGDHQHVRFLLPGGYGAYHFKCFGIDDGHRLIQLRGHVEQIVHSIEDRAMGADPMTKVDMADDLAAGEYR